jgi:hypothetical protein
MMPGRKIRNRDTMTTAQISRRVDELTATGIPAGQAIAQAVTEANPRETASWPSWRDATDGENYSQPLGDFSGIR